MDKTGNTFNSAAYGGPGWQGRTRTHREEIGDLWAASGIDSEYAPLRSVLLHRPGGELAAALEDPNSVQMLEPLDLGRTDAQGLPFRVFLFRGRQIGAEIEQIVLDAGQHLVDGAGT